MDKDRIKGSAQQAKGAVKEVAGKITGDAKLEAEGKSDTVAGKVQNAVGGLGLPFAVNRHQAKAPKRFGAFYIVSRRRTRPETFWERG